MNARNFKTLQSPTPLSCAAIALCAILTWSLSFATARGAENKSVESPVRWRLKAYAHALVSKSKSRIEGERILAVGALAEPITVACLKEETVLTIINAACGDPSPEVRWSALCAIDSGLSRFAIIKPVLPLVKVMRRDSSPKIARGAKVVYVDINKRLCDFRRRGVTSETLRPGFFQGNIVPRLY